MASPTIFNSDAMKPIEGVPKKLELINGWRVPSNSLKKMVGDGYVLIGDGKLLVPDSGSKLWEAVSLKPGMFGFSIDLKKLFRR